jgi:hypothetical protein
MFSSASEFLYISVSEPKFFVISLYPLAGKEGTQVVKSKVARQTEVVLKSFKQQGNEDTTIESSELLKNTNFWCVI